VKITEVRIKLMSDPNDRLQAFCSITFDHCFVIRDLKIIQGSKGSFVAMPSRKLTDRCPRCDAKNHLRAPFCSECGARLDPDRAIKDVDGRAKLYADIAHPINTECREMIQEKVIRSFEDELVKSKQPGYICSYDDHGEENYARLQDDEYDEHILPLPAAQRTADGQIRRFDGGTAPSEKPAAPHMNNSEPAPPKSFQTAERRDEQDESFGAGLV
jgi:stage V sporulation protein G